ncbi:hypothetical protein B0H16DRAFT_1422944 [Mycena metata]|uniref:F-box domain-containing protein n=1 Tax=Mycena metata TaxID=1033252 RepID=A0AAD7N2E9_9AGAR|nr:hypothetical protein B0H16DRAFT_1422944 [Mycena metata]
MHRCLEIQEVLQIIFENLHRDHSHYFPHLPPTPPADRGSLARIARTCRGFSDIALDILWREQYSLLHLLKCLPSHTWEMVDPTTFFISRQKIRFRAPVRTPDWDRVLFYARRVQTMSVYTQLPAGAWLEAVELLAISLPVTTLFPRLRTLKWATEEPALFPYIRMFLSPTLKSIDLHFPSDSSRLSVLSYLSSKVPSLAIVNIHRPPQHSPEFDQQLAEEATIFLLAVRNIQEFTVPAVLPAAYERLASLSSLKRLTIENLDGCPPPDVITSDLPSFRSLTHLHVEGSTIQLVKNLLQWCERTPLESFYSRSNAPATGAVVYDLLVTLSDGCIHHRLTLIDIQLGGLNAIVAIGPNATAYEILPATLRPLLMFPNLSSFTISSPFSVSLDNDFIDAMSIAWPKIETISFRGSTTTSRPILSALSTFALRCPHLRYLELEFDASTVPQGPHPPTQAPHVRQTRLVALDVGDSPIESPTRVAHFLSATFPDLQDITANRTQDLTEEEEELDQTGHSAYHKWREVEKLVPLLAAARSEEETFWMAQTQTPGETAP